jgi:hypothetical protein
MNDIEDLLTGVDQGDDLRPSTPNLEEVTMTWGESYSPVDVAA